MPVTPEVLTANREVVAWLGALDVSFGPDEEPWFTIDGVESGGRLSPGCLPLPDGERSDCPWRCEASSSAIRVRGRGIQ
ncbi:hypothetical protein SAMN05216338_1007202 [Bradyrhizobium sp. Rc2d]|nr:hypothetical protein SAMN05216338_1007202 [Bradyrhizobium sp. Rc2d]